MRTCHTLTKGFSWRRTWQKINFSSFCSTAFSSEKLRNWLKIANLCYYTVSTHLDPTNLPNTWSWISYVTCLNDAHLVNDIIFCIELGLSILLKLFIPYISYRPMMLNCESPFFCFIFLLDRTKYLTYCYFEIFKKWICIFTLDGEMVIIFIMIVIGKLTRWLKPVRQWRFAEWGWSDPFEWRLV